MSQYNKNNNLENSQSLPDLFKEIQDIRYGRAKPKELELQKDEIKFNKIYVVDHRFNALGAIIGILFLILFATSINGNYIFATSDEEKVAIGEFEKNNNSLNMMNIISTNISDFTTKDIITEEVKIDYETQYVDNDQLPKDERKVVQEGRFGSLDRTTIKTYENGELIDENIINEVETLAPVEQIIEVGTSEFLFDKKVHIGDTLFTTKNILMYTEPSEESDAICQIYEYIDIKLESEKDGWSFITVDGLEGYVQDEFITSEAVTPGIAEKARIQRIMLSVNPDMDINVPSGLTKEDFVKVLSGNVSDKNKIFENNAEFFYEMEQKYKINGLFLAAIGIHESNWGTSSIAIQKKNLFGYGAYDASAFESSHDFEDYQIGIEKVAKALTKDYINEPGKDIYENEKATGRYYNGSTISGVNIRYASDQNWSNRVFNIMKSLYEKL